VSFSSGKLVLFSVLTSPPPPPSPATLCRLKLEKISHVYVCGLATNYCCKFTAIDAKEAGFVTTFLLPLTRGVGQHPNPFDPADTVKELTDKGVRVVDDVAKVTKL
jgi:nicotinamidase-related amidase